MAIRALLSLKHIKTTEAQLKEVTKVQSNTESENSDAGKHESVAKVFSSNLDNCVINIYSE